MGFDRNTFQTVVNIWFFCFYFLQQNIAGPCKQTFQAKKFVDKAQQCFSFTPQANFLTHNLNFHWRWRWWDQNQAIFLNLFYFMMNSIFYEIDLDFTDLQG